MSKYLLVLCMLASQWLSAHDIKLAVFELSENQNELALTISIDRNDLMKVLQPAMQGLGKNKSFLQVATDYFNEKMAIAVNDECAAILLSRVEYSDHMIYFSGSLKCSVSQPIREIKMSNSCLVDAFSQHENIMKLRLNNKTRSFRLNKDLTSTVAYYETPN